MRYSELPRYYYDHITPPDVAMFQVAPMDKHGYFNFGLSASHVMAVCEMAKVVIVEVNKNMPRCLGGFDNAIHISDVDMIVEGRNDPMGIQPSAAADDVDPRGRKADCRADPERRVPAARHRRHAEYRRRDALLSPI